MELNEKAKSKAQQRFFGMVRAAQKGAMASPSPEVSKAATSMSKSDVKDFASTKHKGLPDKKESMNYSEYIESLKDTAEPIYQKEGALPQCPPGYRFDRKKKDCVPKSKKDDIKGKLDDTGHKGGATYNVWGRTGLNGDGYAYEEPPLRDANSDHWDPH